MKLNLIQKVKMFVTTKRVVLEDEFGRKVLKCIPYSEHEIVTKEGDVLIYSECLKCGRKKYYLANVLELPLLTLEKARSVIESHLIKRLTREKLTVFEVIIVGVCIGSMVLTAFSLKEVMSLSDIITGVAK